MADTKALPVFAFLDVPRQTQELRAYLIEHGAKIDADAPDDIVANMQSLVSGVGVVGNAETDKEVEMILSSISSLIILLPSNAVVPIVEEFCRQLCSDNFKGVGWSSNVGAAVGVLSNLFHGFNQHPRVQYILYVALVKLCGRAHLMSDIDTSTEKIVEFAKKWSLSREEERSLLRLIHSALIGDQKADQAAKTMTALLGTYTDADAASALDDARECVRTAVVDPKSFSFDHLLRLSAVKLLAKSDPLMHEILMLFSEGVLKDYKAFAAKHPKFVEEKLQVDEDVLIRKMRLLTLMTMAEGMNVIALKDLAVEVEIPNIEELEEFIIDAIQVNAITGKINEVKKELHVSSLHHRMFGRPQWELLQQRLISLIGNLKASHENIRSIHVPEELT
ncbi:hypothetical protein AB6A40_005910 [Gnathostoma spinigerum]|uniref:Eukaryotic translation initiation factor 3 subunit M n=1 Tax=Gnathostoma spinigerum TaxID=75299 RepID=A0ABD6EIW5_9BILA